MNFLFDEQMSPRLARALQILGEPVQHVQEAIGRSTPDDVILRYAAKWQYTLVTMDRKIRRRPHERAAYIEAGVGIYFLKTGRKQRTDGWEIVNLVFKHWQAIKADAERQRIPFMRLVTSSGIKGYR